VRRLGMSSPSEPDGCGKLPEFHVRGRLLPEKEVLQSAPVDAFWGLMAGKLRYMVYVGTSVGVALDGRLHAIEGTLPKPI